MLRIELFHNVIHGVRAITAKQNKRGRQRFVEPKFFSDSRRSSFLLDVKLRTKNHPRRTKQIPFSFAKIARLLLCALRSGNNNLFCDWFNPETRWEIRHVRDNGDKSASRINSVPTFRKLTIEMRNHGNQQVGGMLAPIICQKSNQRFVENTDGKL